MGLILSVSHPHFMDTLYQLKSFLFQTVNSCLQFLKFCGVTYNGLLVDADAIQFRCNLFGINGGTGTSGNMTFLNNLELNYSDIEVITNVWMKMAIYKQIKQQSAMYQAIALTVQRIISKMVLW